VSARLVQWHEQRRFHQHENCKEKEVLATKNAQISKSFTAEHDLAPAISEFFEFFCG
jgi:hypothetical protein